MARNCTVLPWRPEELQQRRYDAFIAAVGYEQRARFVAETKRPQAGQRIAPSFSRQKVLAYGDNLQWYREAGFEVNEMGDEQFASWVWQWLHDVRPKNGDQLSLCVDVSSMSRFRIASLVAAVHRLS